MNNHAKQFNLQTVKSLKPFDSLSDQQLMQIIRDATIHRLQAGDEFNITDADSHAEQYVDYLIMGNVELRRHRQRFQLNAGDQQANSPLNEIMPLFTSVLAHTNSAILRVEKKSLETTLQLHWQQSFECEELHIEADMHCVSRLLQNRCLLALPPDNIETVLALMETVEFPAGEYVIQQGEQDNYYYTLLHGRCSVTRRSQPLAPETLLAQLGPGASFGEEALITGSPRNANIKMLTTGTLMRLEKKHFLNYVVAALLNKYDYLALIEKLRHGAKLIDVRHIDEYRHNGHGLHIPLPMLRLRLEKLSKGREYIFCCNDGRLSSAAAFLAMQQGFATGILNGGLNNVPHVHLRRSN